MSLEFPVGTIVIHKSNRDVRFVVAKSDNINRIQIRRVCKDREQLLTVDFRELQRVKD